MTKRVTVELPEPGLPSDRHDDDQIVWYYGPYGEFVIDDRDMNPPEPFPVCDAEGNAWSSAQLREMAAACPLPSQKPSMPAGTPGRSDPRRERGTTDE